MKSVVILLLALTLQLPLCAQFKPDAAYKNESIHKLVEMINESYVFPDLAKTTTDHLLKEFEAGQFDDCQKMSVFAKKLTETVQSVNRDRHMRINAMVPRETPSQSPDRFLEDLLDQHERERSYHGGFMEARIIDERIGYLDIRSFEQVRTGGPIADAYMALLSTSYSIIIDLRNNGGGDPAMVQYLCSYFFDEEVHLNSLYWRDRDRTDEFWTVPVRGTQLPDVPLFILTSDYTFSGAEEFAYNMQTQKRATIIGEVTGGGANPGRRFPVNDYLSINIPLGTAINPVTGTNWEGTGVTPDILVAADDALEKALKMSYRAADSYRIDRIMEQEKITDKLTTTLDKVNSGISSSLWDIYEKVVLMELEKALDAGWMNEALINTLGYTCLGSGEVADAEMLMKCNTVLFPKSANTYDSYGEVLLANGKQPLAISNFEKAVELAQEDNSPMLDLFMKNLENARKDK